MLQFFKKIFKKKNQDQKTIEDMERKKQEMETQLGLLEELEKKIKSLNK